VGKKARVGAWKKGGEESSGKAKEGEWRKETQEMSGKQRKLEEGHGEKKGRN
jgi:hypothetical protein